MKTDLDLTPEDCHTSPAEVKAMKVRSDSRMAHFGRWLVAAATAGLVLWVACSTGDDDTNPSDVGGCDDEECSLSCIGAGMPGGYCQGDLCICGSAADADADAETDVVDAADDARPEDVTEIVDVRPEDVTEIVDVRDDAEGVEGADDARPEDVTEIVDVRPEDSGPPCLSISAGWTFNAGFGAWTHGAIDPPDAGAYDPWEAGVPTGGPGSCRTGGATNQCATTGLAGGYDTCQRAELRSPALDLTPCAASPLRVDVTFWHWYEFGAAGGTTDGGTVEVSTDDGATWSQIAPTGGWRGAIDMGTTCAGTLYTDGMDGYIGDSAGRWVQETIRIPAEQRTSQFRFRFVFGSDGATSADGWYIDDVSLLVH